MHIQFSIQSIQHWSLHCNKCQPKLFSFPESDVNSKSAFCQFTLKACVAEYSTIQADLHSSQRSRP